MFAVLAAAFVGGVVRGFVGFGGALIIILVAGVTFGPTSAVPIAALSGIPATLQLLPSAVRHSEREFVLPFGVSAFVSAPLGTYVLVAVDESIMQVTISAFVLVMVVLMGTGWQPRRQLGRLSLFAAGMATGLVQGATGVGGPPAVTLALARPGTAVCQRANVLGVVTALAFCAMLPMWWHGLFTAKVVVLSGVIVPFYVFGSWLGASWFRIGPQHYFRAAALLVVAVTGLSTLVLALTDLYT